MGGEMTLTRDSLRRAVKPLTRHVNNMLMAQVLAEAKREQVDKLERQVLAENNYEYDTERWGKLDVSGKVTEPKDTYLMKEEHFADYHAKMQAIHLDNGFERAKDGYCPALCAESLLTDAETNLMDAAQEYTGIDPSNIWSLEKRAEYLRILTGLVVKSPGYRAPKFPKAA
jgi:hypothetical protein